MPELPEVETIVRDLQRLATGATIERAEVIREDLIGNEPSEFERRLSHRKIRSVTRRAKNIVLDLDSDRLVVNLGMTGRLLVHPDAAISDPYAGVVMPLGDGRTLLYRDVRRFGHLEVFTAEEWARRDDDLGIEPLSEEFTAEKLYRMTRSSRTAIKTWLMNQRFVVGVGNIYASEALHLAKISPRKAARRLSRKEADRLRDAVQTVLRNAIDFRGTTLLDYRDASGEQGGFSRELKVYGRAGEPCRTCGSPVRRIVQGGRSTFFCSACQRG